MVWESKRHEEEMAALREQIRTLDAEYGNSAKERAAKDAKLLELDHLVGQLLSVNETLICQISGKRISSVKAAAAAPKPLKKKKKGGAVGPPRAASKVTASSAAKQEAGAARRQATAALQAQTSGSSVAEEHTSKKELLGMHEMYVNIANSITGKVIKTVSKASSGGSGGKIKKSIGKASSDTQMRRRLQDQRSSAEEESVLSSAMSEVNVNLEDFEKKYMTPSSSSSLSQHLQHLPAPPSPSLGQPELKGLINSLEEEFESLNEQYQRILHHSGDKNKRTEDTSQELVTVIQRLHKKGEQLRALKSPAK